LRGRIHIDPEKAAAGAFGAPIAHGFLSLSLLAAFSPEIIALEGVQMSVHYGLDRVRFLTPVRVNSRVRSTAELLDAIPTDFGGTPADEVGGPPADEVGGPPADEGVAGGGVAGGGVAGGGVAGGGVAGGEGVRITVRHTVEIEGEQKPALVATRSPCCSGNRRRPTRGNHPGRTAFACPTTAFR
jgi:hypothetical protein